MVERIDSKTTYTAESAMELPLSAATKSGPIIDHWFRALIQTKKYPYISHAGYSQFEGLAEHADKRVAEAVGKCSLKEACVVEASLPGAHTGNASEADLKLNCKLMDFLNPEDAEAAEARCNQHYKTALARVQEHILGIVEPYELAVEQMKQSSLDLSSTQGAL